LELKQSIRSRRTPRCPACFLPTPLCLCAELQRLPARTRVVVIMPQRESITSTNTGRLGAALLEGASVRVRGLRGAPAPAPLPEGKRLLLFPCEQARPLVAADAEGAPPVLLVPDGTWSQARKLVRREPLLAEAEAVTLPPASSARYGLRRNAPEGTVCTLEAIARALGVLEGPSLEAHLLAALDRFVERSRAAREGRFPR
jgi:DTW domain-containing protein YfiP